jgi:hypothetical protein
VGGHGLVVHFDVTINGRLPFLAKQILEDEPTNHSLMIDFD